MTVSFSEFLRFLTMDPMIAVTALLTLGVIFGKRLDRRAECDCNLCFNQSHETESCDHDGGNI